MQIKQWSKGTKTIDEYIQGFITIFDQLALLGKLIDHGDQIEYILSGLPDDYKAVADQLEGRDLTPSLTEVHEKLLNKEAKLLTASAVSLNVPVMANIATNRPQGRQQQHNQNHRFSQPWNRTQQHHQSNNFKDNRVSRAYQGGYQGRYQG